MPEIEFSMGRLEGRLTALEGRTDRLESSIAERLSGLEAKLEQVLQITARAQGGGKVALAFVSGAAGLVGYLLPHILKGF